MIDRGLLLSVAAIAAGVAGIARLAPPRLTKSGSLFDLLTLPLLAGVAAARVTTRQHGESLVVLAATGVTGVALLVARIGSRHRAVASPYSES